MSTKRKARLNPKGRLVICTSGISDLIMPRGGSTQRQVSPCYASRNMQWDEIQRQTLNSVLQAPEDQYWWVCFETWLSLAGSERSLSPELGQQLVCLLLTSSAFSLSKPYCDSCLSGPATLHCSITSASELFLHSPLTAAQRWAPQGTNLYPDQNQRKCGGSVGFHKLFNWQGPWMSTTVTYGK